MGEVVQSGDKVRQVCNQFIQMFGRGIISVYSFPAIGQDEFMVFMDSLRITLRRNGTSPAYVWQFKPDQQRYQVVLVTNGYFRINADQLQPIIGRLWSIRSSQPYTRVLTRSVDPVSLPSALDELASLDWCNRPSENSWHQRSFGTSRLLKTF